MINGSLGAWLHALSSTVAAGALVGAFMLYGDVRAMQEYVQSDAQDVQAHSVNLEKLAAVLVDHGKLLAQLGTLCAENYHNFERLEPRIVAIEGTRWTSDMERDASRGVRREMDRLAGDVEKNAARIQNLSDEFRVSLKAIKR